MPTIALPARFGFTRVDKLALSRGGVSLRSRYTAQAQRVVYPFAIWRFEGNLVDYPEDQGAREIRAFLVALEGRKNNFDLPVPGYAQPANYSGLGLSLTVAALVRAVSMTVTNRGAGYIKAGEYFTINNELKIATADLTAGGVLAFQPPLRAAAGIGVALVLVNPYCRMIADDNDIAEWGIGAPTRHGFKLNAVEDI